LLNLRPKSFVIRGAQYSVYKNRFFGLVLVTSGYQWHYIKTRHLIGLWLITELGACKKHLMYIIVSSFKKLHHSFSSWVLQHVKFVMVIYTKRFKYLNKFLCKIIKILNWFITLSVFDKWEPLKCLAKISNSEKYKISNKNNKLDIKVPTLFFELNFFNS
jgi:hypothetical protein